MGTRLQGDGESPSASTYFLPQFRQSRRGSIASLSSINQIDKEALSQALDQIHTTASQTDTLTTFNEFSPPPPSSTLDTKGIAGDLQGGISGLYNRFRASVGNVIDPTNVGSEDDAADRLSTRSFPRPSPTPSTKGSATPTKIADQSPVSVANHSRTASGHQSLITNSSNKVRIEPEENDGQGRSRLKIAHDAPRSKPLQTTQPIGSTSVSPGIKDNTDNTKPKGIHPGAGSSTDAMATRTPSKQEESLHRLEATFDTPKILVREDTFAKPSLGHTSSQSILSVIPDDKRASGGAHLDQRVASAGSEKPSPNGLRNETRTGATSAAAIEKVQKDAGKGPQNLVDMDFDAPLRTPATAGGTENSEALDALDRISSKSGQGALQRLGDVTVRKSMVPPLVSHGATPRSGHSRASSTDTNTDSLRSAQRQLPPRQANDQGKESYPSSSLLQVRPLPRDPRMMNVFSQSRNKVLSKEYWMKDEGARECFNCGEAFSTFRRKHHCRICGQIFDSRCTSILSGERFGHSGPLRVCKTCEVNDRDDSSDGSEDTGLLVPNFRPRHGSTGGSDHGDSFTSPLSGTGKASRDGHHPSPGALDFAAPAMSIPATRKTGEKAGRKPPVLEIDASHTLARPSSSRSLKSAFGSRPHFGGHRRHNSRVQRAFKALREDEAPFQQDVVAPNAKESRLPVFHDDNIIDPDLAPYLSEEESSGDEQVNIMAALNGDNFSKSFETERHVLGGLSSGSRKGRSKFGEKSMSSVAFASRDSDNHSLHSVKVANAARSAKRRNLSFSGANYLRPSPRNHRANLASLGSGLNLHDLHESMSSSSVGQLTPTPTSVGVSRMIRSSSMKGDAAPAIELNNASLQHVKKLLHQLLVDSKIPNIASWEKALVPILLRATDDVNPDVQGGDDIDIRHYVKLKKIPGGRPGDTSYVSGLVFTKNLALKSMPRSIAHPNILILTFPLEYTRQQQHFMSLEPVIRQEREFLQNLVNRIAALRPQLLLVERNVSGLALEMLEQADIATAYNVKSSVLEAVSRCCQTKIISSIDKLAVKPAHPGKCASFHLRTYVNKGQKKTYMFLSGCTKELGCTIVLRGDGEAILSKMKRITEFMTYVVYNLKLETCLMRDEYALIPAVLDEGSLSPSKDLTPPQAKLLDQPTVNRSSTFGTETSAQSSIPSVEQSTGTAESDLGSSQDKTASEDSKEKSSVGIPREDSVPDDIPMPTFYGDMVEQHKTKILSASPFVKFMQPYLLMRAREQERRLAYLKRLRDQDILEEQKVDEKPKVEKFDLIKPEMIHEIIPKASRKVREVLHAVHDAEYDKALHTYQTQTKQWETYIAGSIYLFDPYAHQNIVVLFSLLSTVTNVPCTGPDLVALGFYNEHDTDDHFESDCTLGQYIEELCFSAKTICLSNGCEKRMTEHHRQYVHGEAQLRIFVEEYPCKVPGMEDSILMWSFCKICEQQTPAMLMSENTWKYSFGKYLELSFWSSDLKARGELCPHDLHRDHLRYFGYRNMALRVHYDPITLLEIIVPRARITWKVESDLRFKNDLFTRIEERMNKYMLSVRARIKSINMTSVAPEKVDACKEEVDRLSKKAADEHHNLIQKLRKRYMNSKHFEVIPLNRAIKATAEKVTEWDNVFADFDRNFLPSEKDIRRLATLQLKSIFMEQEDTSKTSSTDGTTTPSQDSLTEKLADGDVLAPQTRDMSQERADEFLASVVEKHVGGNSPHNEKQDAAESATSEAPAPSPHDPGQPADAKTNAVIVPPNLSENLKSEQITTQDNGVSSPTITHSEAIASGTSTLSAIRSSSDMSDPKAQEAISQTLAPAPERNYTSSIPRPVDLNHRLTRPHIGDRTQTQLGHARSAKSSIDSSQENPDLSQSFNDSNLTALEMSAAAAKPTRPTEKKLSDRLGLTALKAGGAVAHSMIPRSIGGHKGKTSKVTSLARHFEQLSREFERERIKERRLRQATNRQSRAYPMAASKPIVQVYRNAQDAVGEKDASEEELLPTDLSQDHDDHQRSDQTVSETTVADNNGEMVNPDKLEVDNVDAVDTINDESRTATDVDEGLVESDEDYTIFDDIQIPGTSDEHHALTQQEANLNLSLDLPKHEKNYIMKMLTNFWAERTASGWKPLDYPLNATDHLFADSDIIVREDEPSSLIAFAMTTEDYQSKISAFSDSTCASSSKVEEGDEGDPTTGEDDQNGVEQTLLRSTGTHLQYQVAESSAKMLCKVFYAEQFDALRRKCGVSDRFIESISRCMKWDSKGGKTKSVFLKTLDDRFVLKSLSPIEVSAFLKFAPAYFRIMSESLFHELPSVIAKMLGFYQVIIKNPATNTDINCFFLVMENLFYDRSPTRIFDLKGSMRNRRIQSTGEQNEVLLDENMVEFIYESPLFSREHSKKILRSSVWNDTLFLARQNVMDYSLMIAIDENRKELVVGIIDCIRTYTWDKKLETWIKDRGKNRPTVTSPKEYKSRFREAMSRYVLQAPNCWHQFEGRPQVPMKSLSNVEEPVEEKVVQTEGV